MREYVYSKEINERIFHIRTALHLSQAAMAEIMGYSKSFLGKIESNQDAKVNKNVAMAICATFSVNYDYLVFGEGPMFNDGDARRKAIIDIYDDLPEPYQEFLFDYFTFLKTRKKGKNLPDAEE